MKSRVIFASLILALGMTTLQATAATTTNTDDSPAAKKPASAMLVNGSEKQFAAYIERNASQFSRNTNWQTYMRVVSLYNQHPVAVLSISPADRIKFNEASTQINTLLAKQKNVDASRWTNQADLTTRMINFLWNSDQAPSEPLVIQ
ncbi:hypothetical protein HU175_07425 [Spirosoma sp. KUDC1026]|nr:hypothetical protein HU175_07425 [Spirosoma sp. KUDC1026]